LNPQLIVSQLAVPPVPPPPALLAPAPPIPLLELVMTLPLLVSPAVATWLPGRTSPVDPRDEPPPNPGHGPGPGIPSSEWVTS
jgi:hypothetical protein